MSRCGREEMPQPEIYNRPGLSALVYRLGTHGTFLRRMLARLFRQYLEIPSEELDESGIPRTKRIYPLQNLKTRATNDPSIALLDAWATVGDVLTFYQERIADEGYLRTATERRSVLELARTIGYELNPGVAASTFLAFTVEDMPGSPGMAIVPQGTKVQSIPGPGQLPQSFETSAEITARAEWNALRPRMTRPQELAIKGDALFFLGISTEFGEEPTDSSGYYPLDPAIAIPSPKVQAVEASQIYLAGTNTNLKAGDLLLFVGKNPVDEVKTLILPIRRVEEEAQWNRTRIDLTDAPSKPVFAALPLEAGTIQLAALPFDETEVAAAVRRKTWRERDLSAFLSIQGWSRWSVVKHIHTTPEPKLPPADAGIFCFRHRLSFFGHNAPLWKSLPKPENLQGNPYPQAWDDANNGAGRDIWTDSQGSFYSDLDGCDVHLDRSLPEVVSGSWSVFESGTVQATAYRVTAVTESSMADYGLSAKTTGLKLAQDDGITAPDKSKAFRVRKTSAYVQSQPLELVDLPIEDPVAKGSKDLQLDRMVLGLQSGQPLILSGQREDMRGVTDSEVIVLTDIQHSGGYTTLYFKEPLKNSYVRKTVTLNANVVLATHGETVTEVLGSGDGSQANQRFTLRKPPLTYVSASTASGSQSALRVRVNGILWEKASSLYGLDSQSESYIVRMDDDKKASLIFGDGQMGARLPTGMENITATYRSGIGVAGMVGADKLTLLQARPLGIRSVTNPLPAGGAEEPESRDNARTNAPLTVLTLDRIVSLRDFEDFSRAFAGIGKAQAVLLWKGHEPLVHITVAAAAATAAPDSEEGPAELATHVVEKNTELYGNLCDAIREACDPAQPFEVDSYQPVFFNVRAKVMVDTRHDVSIVLAEVEAALKNSFSFSQRSFGQSVTKAEVIAVIQNVSGVIASDLDQFHRYRDNEPAPEPDEEITPPVLEAERVRWDKDKGEIIMAELLLINPAGIALEEMRP